MTDLAWLTVSEASELIRTRQLSPVEYAKALIERAQQHDKHYNAYLRPAPDIALEDARRAESEILRGDYRGPFHGVPYGLKDIVDYAGLPTTAHSKILRDNVARNDAVVTQKLRNAGGVTSRETSPFRSMVTAAFATGTFLSAQVAASDQRPFLTAVEEGGCCAVMTAYPPRPKRAGTSNERIKSVCFRIYKLRDRETT